MGKGVTLAVVRYGEAEACGVKRETGSSHSHAARVSLPRMTNGLTI